MFVHTCQDAVDQFLFQLLCAFVPHRTDHEETKPTRPDVRAASHHTDDNAAPSDNFRLYGVSQHADGGRKKTS